LRKYFVAIAGNIGVGKSSLTERLAEKLAWEPFYEAVEENPYLADFYGDMRRWSFPSQIFFLSRRLRHHHALLSRPGSVLQDRTVYEDAEIFARNLYAQGLMGEREWRTYYDLYTSVEAFLPPPNLVVYLKASVPTLLRRIELRGREYEAKISREYLEQLNELYDSWAASMQLSPVLTVSTDNLDFVHCDEHLERIARRIDHRLHGAETLQL
jgi:deoxyadenosine/deoxycytidine kinase